jgi:uncharacterized LabA/DUF88 family protein
VYVDGFNLYYRAVKNTPYRWLDIAELCRRLLPRNDVVKIKYFTARVSGSTDPDKPLRQRTYLRALSTLPNIQIVFGQFLSHSRRMPIAYPVRGGPRTIEVLHTEEKGSDVNIAAHMVHDAHCGRHAAAVLISNDSDLCEPVRIVRDEIKLPVGIVYPSLRGHPSRVLVSNATFVKQIRAGLLQACQFPPQLKDASGVIRKPSAW